MRSGEFPVRNAKKGGELCAEQPAFGQQATALFHGIAKTRRTRGEDDGFAEEGAAFGAADGEDVDKRG